VLEDDTLVSMASGGARYSISFFTFRPFDEAYAAFARRVAETLAARHRARLHWGKYFPLPMREAVGAYPRFKEFRELCRTYDAAGAFWKDDL